MVTIWVGPLPEKEKFTVHKDALSSRADRLLGMLDSLPPQETEPALSDRAYLLDEQLETFGTFLKWLYAAYIGVASSVLPSSNLALVQLYIFARKFCVNLLEDAIVSVLYEKFANDNNLLLSLGSDKPTLETLIREVPPDTHLYRLVVRSVAYSMRLRTVTGNNWSRSEHDLSERAREWFEPRQNWSTSRSDFKWPEHENSWPEYERKWPDPERKWVDPEDESGLPACPSRTATKEQVEEVMSSVPSELWVPISRENLLVLTLDARSQDFVSTVGHESDFLRRCEVHDGAGISAS